jgi:Domain of unknown function (DUF4124)
MTSARWLVNSTTLAAACCLAGLTPPVLAQVFKCANPDGKVTYQAGPCATGERGATLNLQSSASATANFGPMKDGWNESERAEFKDTCVAKISADFRASWEQQRRPGVYPESEYRESSMVPYCECLARRVSASVSRAEYEAHSHLITGTYVREAMAGGPCKPVGRWGRELDKSRIESR